MLFSSSIFPVFTSPCTTSLHPYLIDDSLSKYDSKVKGINSTPFIPFQKKYVLSSTDTVDSKTCSSRSQCFQVLLQPDPKSPEHILETTLLSPSLHSIKSNSLLQEFIIFPGKLWNYFQEHLDYEMILRGSSNSGLIFTEQHVL